MAVVAAQKTSLRTPLVGVRSFRHSESAARAILLIIISSSIIFPTAFTYLKTFMLLIVAILVIQTTLVRPLSLSPKLYSFSLFYVIFGILCSIYGLILGNPGALAVLSVMAIYPLLVPFYTSLYRHGHDFFLDKMFVVSAWIIVIIDLTYIVCGTIYPNASVTGLIERCTSGPAGMYGVTDYENFLKFSLPNISSIIFLFPYLLTRLISRLGRNAYLQDFILLVLLFFIAIASGRRALFLTMFLSPLLAFGITARKNKNKPRYVFNKKVVIISILLFAVTSMIYVYSNNSIINNYVNVVSSISNFSTNESNYERAKQYNALRNGIVSRPLFGNGAGAAASYNRGGTQMPWAYELTYIALMFQYGIIGFLLYAAGVVFLGLHLIQRVREKGRSSFEFYFLTGFIAFIVANATNPYLGKFDYMWALFIPYAILNASLLQRNRNEIRERYAH